MERRELVAVGTRRAEAQDICSGSPVAQQWPTANVSSVLNLIESQDGVIGRHARLPPSRPESSVAPDSR